MTLGLLAAACDSGPPPEPAARLEVAQTRLELPYPEWRTLHLEWTPLRELEGNPQPSVFVHLLSSEEDLVRTFDHPFPGKWQVGETLSGEVQLYQSALADPLPPGEYELRLGLYSPEGQRWPLELEAQTRGRWEYPVASITVPAVSSEGPSFRFQGIWTAETGGDAQILSRNWLSQEGALVVENLEVPGSLWLQILIPPSASDEPLVPAHKGLPLSLEIHSACSGITKALEPPGLHRLVLPVFPEPDRLGCEVTFIPNYQPSAADSLPKGLAAVEVLAWSPAEL